jgi:hypothetical protein
MGTEMELVLQKMVLESPDLGMLQLMGSLAIYCAFTGGLCCGA